MTETVDGSSEEPWVQLDGERPRRTVDDVMETFAAETIRLVRGAGDPWRFFEALRWVIAAAADNRVKWPDACRAMRIPGKYAGEQNFGSDRDELLQEIVSAALHVAGEHWAGNTVQAHKANRALADALRRYTDWFNSVRTGSGRTR